MSGIRASAHRRSRARSTKLALHRMREQLVKFRTAQTNGLMVLLKKYGDSAVECDCGGARAVLTHGKSPPEWSTE